jgi:hypothetical protein
MKTVLAVIGILVILACLGSFLVLVVGVVAIGGDEAQKVGSVDAPAPEQAPPQPAQSFAIGDIINTSEWGDDWTITVHAVHFPTGEGWRPKEGNKFIMLDLEVINASDEAQILSSITAYNLKDSQNREYNHSTTSAAPGNAPSGDFARHEAKSGPVVFQVPQDAGQARAGRIPGAPGCRRVRVRV